MKKFAYFIVLIGLILTACGQSSPTWQEQYDLGVRYLEEGNYEEAIIAFTAAIEIDPKQAPTYVGRGDAYIGSGETEENLAAALADYEKAVELDQTCVEGYLGIADVYIRQGEFDKALEILKVGLEKTGNDQSIADKIAEIESGDVRDSDGNTRRQNFYDGNGNLLFYAVYRWPNGLEDITTYGDDKNLIDHGREVLDNDGNMIEYYTVFVDTGELIRTLCTYDSAGNEIIYEDYMPDGTRSQRREMSYNEKNQKIKEYYWHTDDVQPRYCFEYSYDAKGNMIESIQYDADRSGIIYSRDVYDYDENGNEISMITYDTDGSVLSERISEYDAHGNMTKRTDTHADGTVGLETYDYEYDDNGNMTDMTSVTKLYRNGELLYSSEW